jgi:hypothetical protein
MQHLNLLEMWRNKRALTASTAVAASLIIAGCGGGSGSGSNDDNNTSPSPTETTFSGSVTAPDSVTSQTTAHAPGGWAEQLLAALQPSAAWASSHCTAYGLCDWDGATVELRRLQDDGSLGDDPLASTTVSDGSYQLTAEVSPASDLVVVAYDSAGNRLRSHAVGEGVDVDPVSHFIATKLKDELANNGTDIGKFSNAEVQAMVSVVREIVDEALEEGSLDFTGKSIDQSVSSIDSEDGSETETLATAAKEDSGTTVGDGYNLLQIGLRLGVDGNELQYDFDGTRYHGSVSTTDDGDSHLTVDGSSERYLENWWIADYDASEITEVDHKHATFSDLVGQEIGPYYASPDGRLYFSGAYFKTNGGVIAGDGNALAFTGHQEGIDQFISIGAAKWDAANNLSGTHQYNMVGLSLIGMDDTPGSVGARIHWGDVATLDAGNDQLTYTQGSFRQVITSPGVINLDFFTRQRTVGTKTIALEEQGRIYKVKNGQKSDSPFGVVAPQGDMLLTLGRKNIQDDGRARVRLRVGLPTGTCDTSTLSGTYHLQYFAQGFGARDGDSRIHDFHVDSDIGRFWLKGSGDHSAIHGREVDLDVTLDGATSAGSGFTDLSGTTSVSVNGDCTFTLGSSGAIRGIIHPEGETLAWVQNYEKPNGDGTAYELVIGFRDNS